MPYRNARTGTPKLTADPGIVDDMVRQFADRHAFLRELVQNGIDAGATHIDVRVERSPDGLVRTSVEDDGSGMTRKIIEGPLLTLFESSKESDSTKIGKYGVGFVSVFATEPEHVEVRTRTTNETWFLKLFGDHSFELADGVRRPGTGTEVVVVATMDGDAFAVHAALARTALTRWCRHARVPISFVVLDGDSSGEVTTVNVPLTLPGLVRVEAAADGETFVVAVGAVGAVDENGGSAASALETEPTFAGFYNRGLTLMETTDVERGLDQVRFKIDSPRLSHTLSRDSVRRDDQSRRVIDRVRGIVEGSLWYTLRQRLLAAAENAATGDAAAYAALLEAALVPAFAKKLPTIAAPLVDPIEGCCTMELRTLLSHGDPVLVSDESTPLSRAIAATGRPVLRGMQLAPLLRRVMAGGAIAAESAFAFATAAPARDEDRALLGELERLLRAAGRNLEIARLALFEGASADVACRVVRTSHDSVLSSPEDALERRWGGSATLFLNVGHATVRLARRRAKSDVAVAAHLLCRSILLAEGALAAKVVDRLLHAAGPDE